MTGSFVDGPRRGSQDQTSTEGKDIPRTDQADAHDQVRAGKAMRSSALTPPTPSPCAGGVEAWRHAGYPLMGAYCLTR